MINDLYVLVLKEQKELVICDNLLFNLEAAELYEEVSFPCYLNIQDSTELVNYIIEYIKEELYNIDDLDLENCNFHFFNEYDLVELSDGSIVNRNFIITPMYIDRCTINGDLVQNNNFESGLIVQRPNSDNRIIVDGYCSENLEEISNKLVGNNILDKNCTVTFFGYNVNNDSVQCDIKDGNLIIPATIKEDK